jgi:hypothetical protein
MNTVRVPGHIDENHRLTASVPASIPVGPVTVFIVPASGEDDAGNEWMTGMAQEGAEDLNDPRQDIYTLSDGEPVCES